jgi:hypothetical protein
MQQKPRRIRPLLLVLLWVWAGCILLVLDLFWNVEHLGGLRPRARLYSDMRRVAHEMVGEPLDSPEAESGPAPRARRAAQVRLDPLPAPLPVSRPGSRHANGRPDAATPQGRMLQSSLFEAARSHPDPERRRAAMRSLAGMFGPAAQGLLAALAEDPEQTADLRNLAGRLSNRATLDR